MGFQRCNRFQPAVQETEPAINATPITCYDRARERARALMAKPVAAPPPGFLYGEHLLSARLYGTLQPVAGHDTRYITLQACPYSLRWVCAK